MLSKNNRVVVTGLGMLTPLGLDVCSTWENLVHGRSGIRRVTAFHVDDLTVQIAGLLQGFHPVQFGIDARDADRMALFSQVAVAAAAEAIRDAGLVVHEGNAHRIGVCVGSGIGGLTTITDNHDRLVKHGPRRVSPFFIPMGIINMAAGQVSIVHGLKGPNLATVSACTTGTHNIGLAARLIAHGDADLMLAGGTEMATSRLCLAGFSACRALSATHNHEPEKASRPWDKDRDGFVLGEGAGVLVLESLDHALSRQASIYAELVGFSMSSDAYHITAPEQNGQGWIHALRDALADAQLEPSAVDYINAHATSTPLGDALEAKVVETVFADSLDKLAISSTKSMTGHLLGATGAVEAIFSILAIRDNLVPPTINLDNPEPGFKLNFVPNQAQSRQVNVSLSNSFGFGGTNGSLIFKRFSEQ